MSLSVARHRGQYTLLYVWFAAVLLAALMPGTAEAAPPDPRSPAVLAKVDPALRGQLTQRAGTIEAIVTLRADPTPGAPADLAAFAEATQAELVDRVRGAGDEVVATFWLKNMVLVKAKPSTLEALTALESVEKIIPNFELTRPEPQPGKDIRAAAAATWGLSKIGADRVQAERGLTGEGVRVAVLDTGIDPAHPDLAGKLVTDDPNDPEFPGGWIEFDDDGQPIHSTPHDSSFHGTHVAGTIAGGDKSGTQIGVAPGAELMAGLVIPAGSGTIAQVIAGMQWAIAPFDADGNPAGRPADVVSMSLGAEGHADELVEPARNILAAGSFPSFAIGNDCLADSSSSPGNVFESVAVGATDSNDNVAGFSCGEVVAKTDWIDAPAEWPDSYVVPDLSAPGVDVLSAMPGGEYASFNGTSMATPHVSGTVALMLQARHDLSVEDVLEILIGTAVADDRYGALPNPRYGYGRIDAYAAVAEASLTSGIRGTVRDDTSGRSLAGVTVERLDDGRTVSTDAQGRFEFRLAAGTYDLRLSRFGYYPSTERVVVKANGYTDVTLELDPTRRGTISGRVVYGPTGSTVPGTTVRVLDVPDSLVSLTDRSGRYTIEDVPEGTYQVVASAPGISSSAPASVRVRGSVRKDLTLPRPFPTERVSLASDGRQANGTTWWPKLSADGTTIAYGSTSSNLVEGDTNVEWDTFVTDLRTGETERVSVSSDGQQGNSFSLTPTLSADGRYVGYNSGATNLVAGDTNGQTDSFVFDRQTRTTTRVSVASDGGQSDGLSSPPSFSADGRYVVITSDATNLAPGDTNNATDVFVHDRQTGTTERVSVESAGGQGDLASREGSISGDGRYVTFHSDATNLVAGDTNATTDVFVHDRTTGVSERVPAPRAGEAREPVISANGNVVVFGNRTGFASGQLFAYDRAAGTTEQLSVAVDGGDANDSAYAPSLSADGRTVAFYSFASNLAPGSTEWKAEVYLRDRTARTTARVSMGPGEVLGDGWSELPTISGDGRYVAFQSAAANLVTGDTNRASDIFVHDRVAGPQARFALTGLTISPREARGGRPVHVTAWLKNVGEAAGPYQAMLRVDGSIDQRRTVQVGAGREVRVSFDVRRTVRGTYTVQLGQLSGQFTVGR
ncbi:S8 family serine peptidase [Tenggerimyces flavus]|uniref:alpha-amylase n=1 Tax=Tenggerimyces flavus TaxID=1708749 RepID=A0ABV7YQR8_9ACTN|nr:S8 family serine peptidase [Tenggerimyces flavus]MBM7786482.1 subtilisin family serine protease/Tol biopolymer transport system component [Tenggerimyces flavus]